MNGYYHPLYAGSLSFFGSPRYLHNSGMWILERPISQWRDGMGLYPIACAESWNSLHYDFPELDLVSLVVVTDPFGKYDDATLKCFDFARPYKEHYIVDLDEVRVSSHHQRKADRAMEKVRVEVASHPYAWGDDWVALYSHLTERHNIGGIAAFPPDSLKKQLEVPGAEAIRVIAPDTEEVVCMLIWYAEGDVAYYHLGASSPKGYEMEASYAAFWGSISYFGGLKYLSLGSGAGIQLSEEDGLARFKRGWANGTRQTYLCGKVLDKEKYAELAEGKSGDFFPIYRRWEG